MIAVSSFRPFDGCPKTIWQHQITANRSWERIFNQIFYFNDRDQRMHSAKTVFLPCKEKPTIKAIAGFCGGLNDWSCLVNADIIIPPNFRRVEEALRSNLAGCAVSRRWTVLEDGDTSKARLVDYGLDFFAATPMIWKKVAEKIPTDFRLGRIVFDNWLVNFFMSEFGNYCYDVTGSRVVFHPQHEDRVDRNWSWPKDDPILARNSWPFHAIAV